MTVAALLGALVVLVALDVALRRSRLRYLVALAAVGLWTEIGVRLLLSDRVAPTDSSRSANAWTVPDHGVRSLPPVPSSLLAVDGRRPERRPGTWRILFLGDSFTAGEGVGPGEDTPSKVWTDLQEATLPLQPEVLNHGHSGQSAWDELAMWREHSRGWQPDVVVWMYVLNDLGAASPAQAVSAAGIPGGFDDQIVDRTRDDRPAPWSYLVELLRLERQRRRTTAIVEAAYREGHDPSIAGPALARLTEAWREVGAPLRARGGRLVVVLWPLLHRLDDYPFRAAHAAVAEAALASGAEALDLLPVFAGREAAALWASPTDHHPNADAHTLAAQAITAALRAGPVQAAAPDTCTAPDPLDAALCVRPADAALRLRAADRRSSSGPGDLPTPFNPRPLIATHLHMAAALTAPDDPLRAEVAARAEALRASR